MQQRNKEKDIKKEIARIRIGHIHRDYEQTQTYQQGRGTTQAKFTGLTPIVLTQQKKLLKVSVKPCTQRSPILRGRAGKPCLSRALDRT